MKKTDSPLSHKTNTLLLLVFQKKDLPLSVLLNKSDLSMINGLTVSSPVKSEKKLNLIPVVLVTILLSLIPLLKEKI